VFLDQRDRPPEEAVEGADHLRRRRALRVAREVTDVEEEHRHLDLLALERGALAEDVLCYAAVDVGAECVADALALTQALDHRVEGTSQRTGLVDRDHGHAHVQITPPDALGRAAQLADRPGHRVGEQHYQPARDRRRHQQRCPDPEHQGAEVVVADHRGSSPANRDGELALAESPLPTPRLKCSRTARRYAPAEPTRPIPTLPVACGPALRSSGEHSQRSPSRARGPRALPRTTRAAPARRADGRGAALRAATGRTRDYLAELGLELESDVSPEDAERYLTASDGPVIGRPYGFGGIAHARGPAPR
jgi:hypothetical protein